MKRKSTIGKTTAGKATATRTLAAKKRSRTGDGRVAAATAKPRSRKLRPTASARRRAAKAAPTHPTRAAAAPVVPLPRRAIFVDVENTSSEDDLLRIVEHLQIDRKAQPVELTAVGNWRTVGARLGRTLAGLGAQLMHSAPAPGVRDWSDLWIAVAAGRWLAHAQPGDILEIVSDDRAFDAVNDAAAASGVTFRRISHRSLGLPAPAVATPAQEPAVRPARRGRGRRGRRSHPTAITPAALPAAVSAAKPSAAASAAATAAEHDEAAHTASQEQIRAALARLAGESNREVSLDTLANVLRAEGFARPPGSPRLITRLRRLKGVEVSATGTIRSSGGPAAPPPASLLGAAADAETENEPTSAPPKARSRRRGGRRRRRRSPAANGTPEAASEAAH